MYEGPVGLHCCLTAPNSLQHDLTLQVFLPNKQISNRNRPQQRHLSAMQSCSRLHAHGGWPPCSKQRPFCPRHLQKSLRPPHRRQLVAVAAAKKRAINVPQPVYAAFTHLPLTKAQVDTVMRRYPSYLSWDVDQELKPRIQEYSDRLDNTTLAKMICTSPSLLHNPVSKIEMLSAWLQSWGIQAPHKVLVKCAAAVDCKLETLKEKANELELMGVPPAYIGRIVGRHPSILLSSSQQTQQRLALFAQVYGVPEASSELLNFLLNTSDSSGRLWKSSFAAQQDVYAYLQSLGGTKCSVTRAFGSGLFSIAALSLALRAEHLLVRLNLTDQRLHSIVCGHTLLACAPARIDANSATLTQLGFSSTQATDMVASVPELLSANWTTVLRQEKWQYISVTMRVPRDTIVRHPKVLRASVRGILLPRWEFLQCIASLRPVTHRQLLNCKPIRHGLCI